jgi:hypothetical protein
MFGQIAKEIKNGLFSRHDKNQSEKWFGREGRRERSYSNCL